MSGSANLYKSYDFADTFYQLLKISVIHVVFCHIIHATMQYLEMQAFWRKAKYSTNLSRQKRRYKINKDIVLNMVIYRKILFFGISF